MNLIKNINFDKLKSGLKKTREKVMEGISELISGKAEIDNSTLEQIEEILITSDIGIETATTIIERTRERMVYDADRSKEHFYNSIKAEMSGILRSQNIESKIEEFKPFVILIVGVNGAGKTTTIGKLAHNYKKMGLNVVIGSADTFRAAANEQLEIWAKRAGVDLVQSNSGADPSSVAFDTLKIASANNADIVLIDTAGRLHTKNNLMTELKKIKTVLSKVFSYAPNEIYLVLDGNTGQNAIQQAKEFSKYVEVSGLILTKLDGTAKGGVIFQLCSENKIPVRYIGVGESIEDLQDFDPNTFVDAFFNNQDK
ncbi:MAG: signal recognition particle-docking protein FtsY [Bacteroidetes bacterium]|nr:signal recognition particle-docking protein FtsY [Bacteroidota bacterium]MBU1678390.1 signal recognition particle-docking protein FtsY [Bacteroidota bacterium]MBU2508633.1 signal recognition particle-docking protein FtsY [Bacteroidota bacterium]